MFSHQLCLCMCVCVRCAVWWLYVCVYVCVVCMCVVCGSVNIDCPDIINIDQNDVNSSFNSFETTINALIEQYAY